MANIAFGSKYFIFSKFSSIPKTSKIEADRAKLIKEFQEFNDFRNSTGLNEFQSLAKYLESKEYQTLHTSIESEKKKELDKVKHFEAHRKSKAYKNYLKFRESAKYKDHQTFLFSKELKDFEDLEKFVNSKKGETNAENQKLYNEKRKSKKIKDFYRFQNSEKLRNFQAYEKSKELADFHSLEKYLQSADHKNLVKSLEEKENALNEKKKKHDTFKNSKEYKSYLQLKESTKFNDLKKWEVVFEEDFADKQLDRKKWMTRYFWGDKLINDGYAFETDKAFPTDGKNLEIGGSLLKIVTRNENTKGKMWKAPFGFIPTDFNYSTGLISTAVSHRQKYGKIEAKIKINYTKPVNYNFWMASQMNLPHVDILKVAGKKTKVDMANLYGNVTAKKAPEKKTGEFTGLDISQDFFIYTLEWTKEKLTWKINGITVNEQTQGVPQEEMYLVFGCGITGKTDGLQLPGSMEIDWVRCYKQV